MRAEASDREAIDSWNGLNFVHSHLRLVEEKSIYSETSEHAILRASTCRP